MNHRARTLVRNFRRAEPQDRRSRNSVPSPQAAPDCFAGKERDYQGHEERSAGWHAGCTGV
jgi:hypothetical protein